MQQQAAVQVSVPTTHKEHERDKEKYNDKQRKRKTEGEQDRKSKEDEVPEKEREREREREREKGEGAQEDVARIPRAEGLQEAQEATAVHMCSMLQDFRNNWTETRVTCTNCGKSRGEGDRCGDASPGSADATITAGSCGGPSSEQFENLWTHQRTSCQLLGFQHLAITIEAEVSTLREMTGSNHKRATKRIEKARCAVQKLQQETMEAQKVLK